MRVLFLFPRSLDANASVGGVAEFLRELCPALKPLGVEPIIYAGVKSVDTLAKQQHTLVDTTVYYGPYIKPGFFFSRKKLKSILQLCQQENIDVIHAQGTYTAGFWALQLFKKANIPYVVTSHSDILTTNSKRMSRGNVRRRCMAVLKHAAAVTHLTPMMEAASHELWSTHDKSTVIGNGIDVAQWAPYKGLPEKNYMLGIGRLERGKGFHILIDMYASLIAQGFTTSLVIAGRGSEEQQLFAQVQRLGLNLVTDVSDHENLPEKSVIFTGYVRDEAKMRLIAQSQFILFATQPDLWEEAFGIVQLEAMAAAKPILASETKVTRYLHKAGMQASIVQPNDVDAWAAQASVLLRDAALRHNMGQANHDAASAFGWQHIAEQYRNVYQDARRQKKPD